MPAGDAWGNSWLNSWNSSWLRSTETPAAPVVPAGGKGDNEKPRRQIFKPTGLPPLRARKTVEERVEETRQIHEEVSREVSEEVSEEPQEQKTLTTSYVARMSLPEIEAEIGRILRKKVITEEDEILLLLMVITVAG